MHQLEEAVDEAVQRFTDRKRVQWHLTGAWLRSDPGLRRHLPLIEEWIAQFRDWKIDRQELLERLGRRVAGREWTADFEAAAAELQEMARDEMATHLAAHGVPEKDASKVAWSYSIGALLDRD